MHLAFSRGGGRPSQRRGAALVVALGLLSLILLLVSAFVLAMQSDRLGARNSRAKEVSREYASIATYFAGNYYLPIPEDETAVEDPTYFIPRTDWLDQTENSKETVEGEGADEDDGNEVLRKAYGSNVTITECESDFRDGLAGLQGVELGGQEAVFYGEDEDTRFATFPSGVTNFLPRLYLDALATNALPLRWQYVNSANADDPEDVRLAGRVTLFLVDLSGQADVHALTTNQWRMAGWSRDDAGEIVDLVAQEGPFVNRPDLMGFLEGQYESISAAATDAMGTYSLDPDPNQIPFGAPIGSSKLQVTNKFDLCSITNESRGAELVWEDLAANDDPRWRWQDAAEDDRDVRDYLQALSNALFRVEPLFGTRNASTNAAARAIFWNLLNDLDADRYPQTDSATPWLDEYGVEALPLVSELCVTNISENVNTDSFGFVDDCPACQALRERYGGGAKTNFSYRASAEVWYPFSCTNGLPESVWLAYHLYKTTYTNDVDAVMDRIGENLGNVTEVVEAHWGTNVVRSTYTHARERELVIPPMLVHTLEFGAYGEGSEEGPTEFVATAGIAPPWEPKSLDEQIAMGDVTVTNDVTLTVLTNEVGLLELQATSVSTNAPLHLYDSLLAGPSGSLLKGPAVLLYRETTNRVESAEGETGGEGDGEGGEDGEEGGEDAGVEEIVLYETTLRFVPEDQAGLLEMLKAMRAPEKEEEPEEPEPPETPEGPENPEAPETPENPEEPETPENPTDPEEPEEPEEPTLPASMTIPVISTAVYNDFGEVVTVVTATPADPRLGRVEPYLSSFLRSDVADPPKETNDATRRRYDITVTYTVKRYGPESQHGGSGMIRAAENAMIVDITPEPFQIARNDFRRDDDEARFASVTNEVFHFDVPVEHTVWDTNGVCVARHTVSNLLSIGLGAYTNVFYLRKPEAVGECVAVSDGSWVAQFDMADYDETNSEHRVASTVFLSAQTFLGEPEIRNLLESDEDDLEDGGESADRNLDLKSAPYDEGPGPGSDDARDGDAEGADPWLLEVNREVSMAVDDPRFNGRTFRWYDAPETLGEPPERFPGEDDADTFRELHEKFAGYPVLHRDGLPDAIGDIGFLGTDEPWETVDLFEGAGAKLADLWCLAAPDGTNAPRRATGRIHAQTPFPMAAAMLFADTVFGTNRLDRERAEDKETKDFCELVGGDSSKLLEILTNAVCTVGAGFHPSATNSLALVDGAGDVEDVPDGDDALKHAVFPFAQWMEVLAPELLKSGETDNAESEGTDSWRESALENALKNASAAGDGDEAYGYEIPGLDRLEDLVRDLPERVTFRQNLVLVVARSDALTPNGRVAATTRTLFLLHRDSWTGRWFVVDRLEMR